MSDEQSDQAVRLTKQQDWFNSDDFREQYHYEGPLGSFCTQSETNFYLWAPTAERVTLNLYPEGAASSGATGRISMTRGERGVWSASVRENLDGTYYDYSVCVEGITRRSADPYARACGINGKRSMVIDLRRTNPAGWDEDHAPAKPQENIIYEIHVRDFSASPDSGISCPHRGKYLALTETGTTLAGDGVHPTGLDYMKRLGVTYVQLMPAFDYGSVDEKYPDRNFNWGYDPVNYNIPEGNYSTDPWHGEVRIREMKQAVQSLHANGFRVILDVVYNHTYSLDSWLWRTVPWYFYRQNEDGTPSGGSGCGNDIASERSMVSRYILESVLYWTEEYHIDGFRFDLMGLLDVPLMNRIRAELDKLYGKGEKLLFGEPWSAGPTAASPGTKLGDKDHLRKLDPGVGAFCDATRDAVKGNVMTEESVGMVNGGQLDAKTLESCFKGWIEPHSEFSVKHPSQTISYLSSHDDWTLWDKLIYTMDPERKFESCNEKILQTNKMAAAICFGCRGSVFFLSGEEFGRTKRGIKNSFESSIMINQLDWKRAWKNAALVDYYRGLIALRKQIPALTLKDDTMDTCQICVKALSDTCCIAHLYDHDPEAHWSELLLAVNISEEPTEIELPVRENGWQPIVDADNSFLWQTSKADDRGKVTVPARTVVNWGYLR